MNPDERKVQEYLEEKSFKCDRFDKNEKKSGKTPDFKVYAGSDFLFFCEVKSVEKDRWLDSKLENAPPGTIVGGLRNDPTFNRLTNDIHTAIKQFDNVNPDQKNPNVLSIVNQNDKCGFLDLLAVVTGNFFADDNSSHPIYKKFSEGRIKNEKSRIHLFLWLDDFNPDRLLFSQTDERHHLNLCSWFDIDPKSIKQISSKPVT